MKKLMKGNEAIAEAAIQAGCRFFFGYPITPQNQIPEYMSKRMPQVGGCFLQSESEVAAINMVYGAGGAGARVMTSSSSPGISLKQEGISYIVGAEVPCVIVNMVRGGPGLGSIQPAQSDYYQATRGGGHGDYRMCVLAPSSVQEAVDLTQEAFDIADRYRNPVMVLGDGLIGQMMEPVDMDLCKDRKPAEDLTEKTWAATGHVATEEAPRAIINSLYIQPDVLEKHCQKLQAKYDAIEAAECRWQEEETEDAEIVIVAYGTTSRICRSAMRKLRKEGIRVGMIRPITLWPFPEAAIRATLKTARQYLCVEMSMGQMIDDVRLAINGERPVDFYGRTGGMVPTVNEIVEKIRAMYENDPLHKATKGVTEAMDAVGSAFDKMGQKIGKAVSDAELDKKADSFRQQASQMVDRTASSIAKGVDAVADTLGKAFSSIFGGGQKAQETTKAPAENNEGGEQ
ncbi:MAG: 3-methyl-2-oxobutanoate dehydrogenase subunit VorB [Clostridiales bacterium]|nr:3-methyl-2-oxobutanoate dehydrogenase subunit VorB [Clostridiales bacterium]